MQIWGLIDKKMEEFEKIPRNRKIEIMGIVNITGNSYIPASRCLGPDGKTDVGAAMARIEKLLGEGAGIIDIGACSTGPGVPPAGEETEWERLKPLMEEIVRNMPGLKFSVDTYRASVAEKVFDLAGSFIVNDISAGEADPRMLPTVGRLGLPYVAMHMRGDSMTMQTLTDYGKEGKDGLSPVTSAVRDYFLAFAEKAEKFGISDWILDPGFGFAKTVEQNYRLLDEMASLRMPGHKTLVGISRKSMIYRKFGISPEEALPETQVLHFAALQRGADILRVHDAAEAARTVELYASIG